MLPNIALNYTAIISSAIVSFVIGMLWYSPILFANTWMKEMGINKKNIDKAKQKGMGKSMLLGFIGGLVMSYVLAHFVQYATASSFTEGMQVGFWLWLGIAAPLLMGTVLWEGKSWKLWIINAGHYLVVISIISGLLAIWS